MTIDLSVSAEMKREAFSYILYHKQARKPDDANLARAIAIANDNVSAELWQEMANYHIRHKHVKHTSEQKKNPITASWAQYSGYDRSIEVVTQLSCFKMDSIPVGQRLGVSIEPLAAVEDIRPEQKEYNNKLDIVVDLFIDNEISFKQAKLRLVAISQAMTLISFLDGKYAGHRSRMDEEQTTLFNTALSVLASKDVEKAEMTAKQRKKLVSDSKTVQAMKALPLDEQTELEPGFEAQVEASKSLLSWLAKRVATVPASESAFSADNSAVESIATIKLAARGRLKKWKQRIVAWLNIGKTYDPTDPDLRWQRGRTKKGCADCIRFDGQVKKASEWRDIRQKFGFAPRARALECSGYNCKCEFKRVSIVIGG